MASCRRFTLGSILVLAFAAGCGGGSRTVRASAEPAPSKPTISPQWSYHPDGPRGLLIRMDLGDATQLFAGRGGERWLVQAREGTAEAAPLLADQDLVAISRPDDGTFAFIGHAGSIYIAESPLGPFTQVRQISPSPMRVAAAGKTIVALHWDGSVSRSIDAGKSFSNTAMGAARPLDVALAPDGRAMVLSYPEELWISRDQAATWTRVKAPTVGAGFVGLDANGSLVARGILQSISWRVDTQPELEVADRAFELPPLDLLTELDDGPSASALSDGRAVLAGSAYFEVARREDEGPWYLGRGRLTERIQWLPIPHSKDCKHMTLGANARRLVLGCMSAARGGGVLFPSLKVMLSRDGGSTFTPRRPTQLVADEESVSLTVLRDDTLLIAGACQPDTQGVCSPGVPTRMLPAEGTLSLQFGETEPAKAPGIVGRVTRIVADPDEKHLYATALLAGSHKPALLISSDRGENFNAVALDLSNTQAAKSHDLDALLTNMQPGKLDVGADGKLSWVLYTEQGAIWVVAGSGGKVLSAHFAPEDQPFVEAVGANGLAYGKDDGTVVESVDGGATFKVLTRLPQSVAGDQARGVWCGVGGCVFGGSFSRSGWGSEAGGVLARQVDDGDNPKAREQTRTPIVCEFVDGARGELGNVVDFPDASDAYRGSVAWSALIVDKSTASVQVARATATPKHVLSNVALLAPTRTPDRMALHARPQAEGAAALRYSFVAEPNGQPRLGSPVGRVEVAWDNQFEGGVQRATVAGGVLRSGDVSEVRPKAAAQANVATVSIAPGGIHVCVHADCGQAGDPITFLRARGASDTIPVPPWPERGLGGTMLSLTHHVMHLGNGKHVPIALLNDSNVVLRAERRTDGSYDFAAFSLMPWKASEFGFQQDTHWSYKPGLMGLSHTVLQSSRGLAYARVLRFDATDGVVAVEPAPTQRDLSDPPVACSSVQVAQSFRVAGLSSRGTRHPVIIEKGGKKELMYTELAVMHGSPSEACVVVMDARSSQSKHRRVLVPIGTPERSWLLSREGSKLSWEGLKCRFQPGAAITGAGAAAPPEDRAGSSSR